MRIPLTEAPSDSLALPQRPINHARGNMPLLFWSISLLLGILILLARMPLHVPTFQSLTQFTCVRLPPLPTLESRQSYPLNLRSRAGDQVVYQLTNTFPYSSRASTTIPCRKQSGPTQIWRTAAPSPNGSYVFQVTCGDLMITNYKSRAALYENTQQFVILIASLLCLVSAIGLCVTLVKTLRSNKIPNSGG